MQAMIDNTKLYYLASPYSAPTHLSKKEQYQLMKKRSDEITEIGARLLFELDIDCIMPITTSVQLKKKEPRLGTQWNYWQKTDTKLVLHSDGLIVAMMDGWEDSVGVQAEIKIAKKAKMPVYYLNPKLLFFYKKPPSKDALEYVQTISELGD